MNAEDILLEYKDRTAIITLNLPKKLNALTQDHYYRLAGYLLEIAEREDVYITVLTGAGRCFSAGADLSTISSAAPSASEDDRRFWLKFFVSNNLHVTRAFYTHPKILVTALNGPAVGLSAALIAWSDFIYAAPHAFILTPFSSLGLVTEGNASIGFVQRMGIAKANEALIMSKRITCDELVQTGFVNKVFGAEAGSPKFLEQVLHEVDERLGAHLNSDSLVKIKALIRRREIELLDKQNVAEVFGGLDRFVGGFPQEEFRKINAGEKKHKL